MKKIIVAKDRLNARFVKRNLLGFAFTKSICKFTLRKRPMFAVTVERLSLRKAHFNGMFVFTQERNHTAAKFAIKSLTQLETANAMKKFTTDLSSGNSNAKSVNENLV